MSPAPGAMASRRLRERQWPARHSGGLTGLEERLPTGKRTAHAVIAGKQSAVHRQPWESPARLNAPGPVASGGKRYIDEGGPCCSSLPGVEAQRFTGRRVAGKPRLCSTSIQDFHANRAGRIIVKLPGPVFSPAHGLPRQLVQRHGRPAASQEPAALTSAISMTANSAAAAVVCILSQLHRRSPFIARIHLPGETGLVPG